MLPPKKTLKRFEVPGTARFLIFSCYRRLRLLDNDRIKYRFTADLKDVAQRRSVKVLAWVVMPEHVHLVVAAGDISVFLAVLKQPFSTRVVRRWRELNGPVLPRLRDRSGEIHFWQAGGGYDRNVVGDELLEKIRYCHANPVRRGLATTSLGWMWSSAQTYENRDGYIGPEIAFDLVPKTSRALT